MPVVAGDARVLVVGDGLADALRGRLDRQLGRRARPSSRRRRRSSATSGFVQNAPRPAVVQEERDREARFGREVAELRDRLRGLGA